MRLDKLKPFILTVLILTIISIYPSTILAQTVAVTGTITDTQTTPYSNGLLTVTFVNATGQLATFGGNPSFQKSYAIYLDANGAFTVSLPPNSTASPSIQPAGTQWNFSYQSQGGYGAANINVTITGAGSISGTLSSLARITWPYGNIPPPGAAGQGIVFVSSTTLGWGTTGTVGAVTHTAGNLTALHLMLGNGLADSTVDSACLTNGTGALSGCTSISTTGNVTGANLPAALPTTPNGVGFVDTSTPSGGVAQQPVYARPGVTVRTMSGTSDIVLVTDLGNIIKTTSGSAITETVPDGGTTPFTSPANFGLIVSGAGDVTLTRTSTSQICTGDAACANTLVIFSGQFVYLYLDASNNWIASVGLSTNPGSSQTIKGVGTSGIPLTIVSAASTANYALRVLDSSLAAIMRVDPEGNGAASFYGAGGANGVVNFGNTSSPTFYRIDPFASLTTTTGNVNALGYQTATNCSSSASPAACGSAAAGSVAVPTGVTPTLVVNTTAVTANSQILFTPDESLGTKLSVTCNSTIAQVAIEPIVTARTAATSFTIQYNTTITVNPICLNYLIVN